jgi:hypothetical protein
MACHILGAANMALMLEAPSSVECLKQEGTSSFTFPKKSVIRFDFPARGSMPPVKIFWYDGGWMPPRPDAAPGDDKMGDGNNGSLFVGDKGVLTTGTYGQRTRLLPDGRMQEYQFPPQLLTRSPGHYRDWIRACKFGDFACSDFKIAGPFTEWILLGTVALRVEGKLDWDSRQMKFTNNKEANRYLKPQIRKGWKFA